MHRGSGGQRLILISSASGRESVDVSEHGRSDACSGADRRRVEVCDSDSDSDNRASDGSLRRVSRRDGSQRLGGSLRKRMVRVSRGIRLIGCDGHSDGGVLVRRTSVRDLREGHHGSHGGGLGDGGVILLRSGGRRVQDRRTIRSGHGRRSRSRPDGVNGGQSSLGAKRPC